MKPLNAVGRIVVSLAVPLFVASLFASDTILLHGHIYTEDPKSPWAEALAITSGRIDAVGSDAEISRYRQSLTKVVDLQGRTVIPGIVDIHEHVLYGGMALHGFNLSTPEFNITPNDEDAFVDTIKVYAASHPDEKVLFGRASFPTTPDSAAKLELLDRAVPDRPLVIHATSEHALWVNSKTLALAGIGNKPVADATLERFIVRDSNGHPTGVFRESSMQLINNALPPMPLEQRVALLRGAEHYLNRFGITSVVELTGDLGELEAFAALRDRGELTIRTRTGLGKVAVNHHLTPQFLADLDKARKLYHDDWVSANLVKFFADGVGNPPPMFYEPAEYRRLLIELDKRGYQIVTHAIGAGAVHAVLDAYADLEKTNGPRDRRLRMEHVFNIETEDMARFSKLSTIVGMQPAFCCGGFAGEHSNEFGSVEKSGALLSFSSDWPCSWPPDPLAGIQEALMREVRRPVTMHGVAPGPPEYNAPDQKITVEQAVAAYTKAGAYAEFAENRIGTLEAGKEADLAVLSQDIFHVRPEQIGQTQVVMTMVGGKVVFTEP
ncbi:MAG TPA: amidohydrolase [Bryobacteraceae bacterium]|nr:amidohydrolase [Bryobacteraceae bacterium]